MLKQETIDKIANLLKIKPADLSTALKDEKEVDVTIDEKLTVLSEDEVNTLGKNKYKEGKQAGVEMEIKEAKEKLGLDFNGKTIDGLMEAHKKLVLADAKIEPEKKVSELQEKVTTLQATVKDYETKIADKDKEVTGVKVNGEIAKHIPANALFGQDKIIGLMKMDGYDFQMVEGKVVPFKDGKAVQDNLANNVMAKDVIASYVKENKLVPEEQQGGRGGKDEKGHGNVFTKLSEVKAKFVSEGKNTLGTEFAAAVAEAAKVEGFSMAE